MLGPRKKLKTATTVVMLFIWAAVGLTPIVEANPCLQPGSLKPAGKCTSAASCCCGVSTKARACCCRQEDAPAPRPPATPADVGWTLKWVPWVDAPAGRLATRPFKWFDRLPARSGLTSFLPSLQSLFCVWRI